MRCLKLDEIGTRTSCGIEKWKIGVEEQCWTTGAYTP